METRTRSRNQENSFGFPLAGGGKLLGKKIEGGGGTVKQRKALQDLTCKNLENLGPTINKSLNIGASNATKCCLPEKPKPENAKKNGGGRRALGDLTNSSKLFVRDASTRKNSSLKLSSSAVVDKKEVEPVLVEEGFLHDHQQCIKAQNYTMDRDYFMETVGLISKDYSTAMMTPKLPPSTKSKLQTPTTKWMEWMELDQCQTPMSTRLRLGTPVMHLVEDADELDLAIEWDSLDFSGFKLKNSPLK